MYAAFTGYIALYYMVLNLVFVRLNIVDSVNTSLLVYSVCELASVALLPTDLCTCMLQSATGTSALLHSTTAAVVYSHSAAAKHKQDNQHRKSHSTLDWPEVTACIGMCVCTTTGTATSVQRGPRYTLLQRVIV
jgi:hypothetical protein